MNMFNDLILSALGNNSAYNFSSPEDIEFARRHAYSQVGPIGAIGNPLQGINHVLRNISGRAELALIDEAQRKTEKLVRLR